MGNDSGFDGVEGIDEEVDRCGEYEGGEGMMTDIGLLFDEWYFDVVVFLEDERFLDHVFVDGIGFHG